MKRLLLITALVLALTTNTQASVRKVQTLIGDVGDRWRVEKGGYSFTIDKFNTDGINQVPGTHILMVCYNETVKGQYTVWSNGLKLEPVKVDKFEYSQYDTAAYYVIEYSIGSEIEIRDCGVKYTKIMCY